MWNCTLKKPWVTGDPGRVGSRVSVIDPVPSLCWPLEGVDCRVRPTAFSRKRKKNEIRCQLCHNNVSSRSSLPSYRIKTMQRDYLYRWQNWGAGRKLGKAVTAQNRAQAQVTEAHELADNRSIIMSGEMMRICCTHNHLSIIQ